MTRLFAILLLLGMLPAGLAHGAPDRAPERASDPCALPPGPSDGHAIVTVDPATSWQPRGGTILAELATPTGSTPPNALVACFAWPGAAATLRSTVLLRPTDKVGTTAIGVPVPDLVSARGFFDRVRHAGQSMGLGLIPLAEMRLVGLDASGDTVLDATRPVGVTSTLLSLVVAVGVAATGLLLVYWLRPARTANASFLLSAVETGSGRAGLAQAQILLWSFVVCVSAAYVMVLTGNLVDINTSTLELLGIAAVAVMGASIQAPARPPADGAADPPAAPSPRDTGYARWAEPTAQTDGDGQAAPRWSDLVVAVDGTGRVDVTRVQMLFFTLVSAGFVAVKVLATYQIPTVPEGYLLLMGLSNGTYLVGRYISTRDAA